MQWSEAEILAIASQSYCQLLEDRYQMSLKNRWTQTPLIAQQHHYTPMILLDCTAEHLRT